MTASFAALSVPKTWMLKLAILILCGGAACAAGVATPTHRESLHQSLAPCSSARAAHERSAQARAPLPRRRDAQDAHQHQQIDQRLKHVHDASLGLGRAPGIEPEAEGPGATFGPPLMSR